jgi:hypothetical protein
MPGRWDQRKCHWGRRQREGQAVAEEEIAKFAHVAVFGAAVAEAAGIGGAVGSGLAVAPVEAVAAAAD